ncbi:hypothetical protein [Anaerotignum sp.]|uniref:hypothetical protein n=1 Tax=Anaerotignum sp. TaxID=2039241 RepID=UPI002714C365|nr:hypothetical protein [Anaerotignum sp.]
MNEKQKEILKIVQDHCINGKELDLTDIMKLSDSLTMPELLEAIPILGNQGYIEVIEIDLCCGADYIVTGITEKAMFLLNSR